jgi:hypothetical protein
VDADRATGNTEQRRAAYDSALLQLELKSSTALACRIYPQIHHPTVLESLGQSWVIELRDRHALNCLMPTACGFRFQSKETCMFVSSASMSRLGYFRLGEQNVNLHWPLSS